jgi:hypothetical protein
MSGSVETFQLSVEAAEAEVYESSFVPALFAEWAPHLVEAAGVEVTGTRTRVGSARFASAAQAVATEIDATPLAGRTDRDTYRRILEAGTEAVRPFLVHGGRVELPIGGHLVTGVKPG